ncbi:type I-E CRISPR-associated protein Cas6/Cse3/CasE [Streptomyces celluloflavus]
MARRRRRALRRTRLRPAPATAGTGPQLRLPSHRQPRPEHQPARQPTARQKARTETGDRRSFRLGHRTAAAQLGWFLTRTARWGFGIPTAPHLDGTHDTDDEPPRDIRITTRQRHSFGKGPAPAKEAHVVMNSVTFEGRLRITDPALLAERLLAGIGPSKSYGCGLLTLAPLPERE